MSAFNPPVGTVVRVTKTGSTYSAILPDGADVTEHFENYVLRKAVNKNKAIKYTEITNGDKQWRMVAIAEFRERAQASLPSTEETSEDHSKFLDFLKAAESICPSSYKMSALKWRFAVRTVLRGKNMMITGPKGTGKTVLAFVLRDALDRPFFNIPLGASQDPRSTLIGNVHFHADRGTFVGESEFIRAIQTPNAIILLDEITRAHPDAWNILMSALDYKQRFVRIDEAPDAPVVNVAEGVTFIATANIGAQYTSTRTLDAALTDRFIVIEIDYLGREQELELLTDRVPGVDSKLLEAVTNVAIDLRRDAQSADPHITEGLSTRSTIEMAELLRDGFTFDESAELVVFPQYSTAAGEESERTYVKQVVQKHRAIAKGDKPAMNLDPSEDSELPWDA